jgi:hypothetical protein
MKTFLTRSFFAVVLLATLATAQDVIPLYPGTPPGSTPQNYPEKEYFSKPWNTEVVTNVTKPTLTVFKPAPELKNGAALIVCPGGGFMALSITSEGIDVAKYMAARGVTAFVLKYRIAHTGEDATEEFTKLYAGKVKFRETIGSVVPLAIADGLAAVTYVRQHASEWGVSPDRVGIIGFSAGGTVTTGVAFHHSAEAGRLLSLRFMRVATHIKKPLFQTTLRPCLSRLRPTITLDSCLPALAFTRNGPRPKNPPNCTSTQKAAMASECASTTFQPIIGSIASPNGWNSKAG